MTKKKFFELLDSVKDIVLGVSYKDQTIVYGNYYIAVIIYYKNHTRSSIIKTCKGGPQGESFKKYFSLYQKWFNEWKTNNP